MKKILIIGSLNMDMVIGMKHMPVVGETVFGENPLYIPGGKGANQAYTAGSLGGNAAMLGCLGKDSHGRALLENMKKSGIDCSGISMLEEYPTGMAVIYVNEEGNNSIVVIAGANKACDVEYLKSHDEMIRESDYVIFQMEIPCEAVFYGIERAKELGKTVILNPAPAPENLPDEILEKVDYLTPNETEIVKLTGKTEETLESIQAGAKELLGKGVKNILVTLGSQGAMLVNEEGVHQYPTRKVDAVDTTAAGDCFNAAFVVGLSEGMSNAQAIRFANTASSIAVTRKGAQSSIPTREEVDEVIRMETR